MALLTATEFQEKHARRLKAAVEDVRKGIDRVTENPCEKAAAKQDKMLSNLTASVQSGKWGAGLKRVSLEDWKRKARDIGVNRIAAGIDGAKEKVVAFAEELLPHIARQQSKIAGMPDVTIDDNINRMTAFIRGMAEFKRTK
ncbi:MAG: hypothetical protein MUP81_03725 [Dehalococcoidia bacterium]|nr:hypothetical protein [Dehalococcoidia bacterium]